MVMVCLSHASLSDRFSLLPRCNKTKRYQKIYRFPRQMIMSDSATLLFPTHYRDLQLLLIASLLSFIATHPGSQADFFPVSNFEKFRIFFNLQPQQYQLHYRCNPPNTCLVSPQLASYHKFLLLQQYH